MYFCPQTGQTGQIWQLINCIWCHLPVLDVLPVTGLESPSVGWILMLSRPKPSLKTVISNDRGLRDLQGGAFYLDSLIRNGTSDLRVTLWCPQLLLRVILRKSSTLFCLHDANKLNEHIYVRRYYKSILCTKMEITVKRHVSAMVLRSKLLFIPIKLNAWSSTERTMTWEYIGWKSLFDCILFRVTSTPINTE